MSAPNLLNVGEVAAELRVSKTCVLQLVHRDGLPAVRIGRRLLVRRETLERFIRDSEKVDSAA